MIVKDPGHMYWLEQLDEGKDPAWDEVELRFVKREGKPYAGTTTQDVIRVLIDRTKYVDSKEFHINNHSAIYHLRQALMLFESQAAEGRGDQKAMIAISNMGTIEDVPTCAACGHILCSEKHE